MREFRYAAELKQPEGYWQIVATNISEEEKMSYRETYVAHGWKEEIDFRFVVYAIFEPTSGVYNEFAKSVWDALDSKTPKIRHYPPRALGEI